MRAVFTRQRATFVIASSITHYIMVVAAVLQTICLSGCFGSSVVSIEQYRRADELIEEGAQALREQRFRDAEAAFSMAYDVAPLAAALDGQGCVAFLRGDVREAERFFRQAYESDTRYDHALANLALLYDLTGRREEARRMYDEVLQREPEAARVRNNRAAMEFEQGGDKQWVATELTKSALLLPEGVVTQNLVHMGVPQRKRYGEKSR